MRRGLALFALALLTACTAETPAPAPSGSAQAVRPGDHTLTITVGDKERTFLLHVPASYDPARAVPAVLALHYRPGSGAAMRGLTGLDAKADAEGFLVAYPEGVGGQFNAFDCCGTQDDVGFVKAVAERLVRQWHADADRLFLAGVSNGGDLSFRTAVEAPGVFAAIGVVSGGFAGGRTEAADYRPAAPVSVVTLVGADDPQAAALRTGLDTWRTRLRCTPAPASGAPPSTGTAPPPSAGAAPSPATGTAPPAPAGTGTPPAQPADPAVHRTSTHCQDGSDVDAYVVDGAGHVWFGAASGELKDTTAKVDATRVLWEFFAAHPRRR
ncbi:polyhydroxybutyrate depolymerase [Dactylosporangium aurantiacum]|uniref:Polyhydroxybutyrate depolymerase n=1 Tax=Dactylosporangium aurantiacum TaxID=35754 RepID=A0A9Q9IGE9_9ACTN|nr:PHB depolymerase family esterase [Dactylosporangium aurantiacum]MDG6104708.1 PHB depolymerase family esterase [Dactylosporangium aurantiacum]UWZ55724.1 polyhydroxybutyrate depolymerase [Dactylosporangium aurantiacum]